MVSFSPLEKQLLDAYQRGFPLTSSPWATIAAELDSTEEEVFETFNQLVERDLISRVGPVFNHHKAGASALASLAVPASELEEVARFINEYKGVNHNYEREHEFNLWFVVTAENNQALDAIFDDIKSRISYPLLRLPMVKAHHIDLGFHIKW